MRRRARRRAPGLRPRRAGRGRDPRRARTASRAARARGEERERRAGRPRGTEGRFCGLNRRADARAGGGQRRSRSWIRRRRSAVRLSRASVNMGPNLDRGSREVNPTTSREVVKHEGYPWLSTGEGGVEHPPGSGRGQRGPSLSAVARAIWEGRTARRREAQSTGRGGQQIRAPWGLFRSLPRVFVLCLSWVAPRPGSRHTPGPPCSFAAE